MLLKKAGILFKFYQFFIVFSLFISVCCLVTWLKFGWVAFQAIFWLKMISYFLIYFFISAYKKHQFFYFHNLGFSVRVLWVSTFAIDLLVFCTLFYIANLFK